LAQAMRASDTKINVIDFFIGFPFRFISLWTG
jgi:hypothetical protein